MGKLLSGIFGASSDFRADTGGQNFARALAQAQGNSQAALQGQTNLANSLAMQAAGGGPNPAKAMLNQASDKNIANNAALIASSKGINPAIAQRLAAQNAATIGQEAAAQGATLAAQQQLSAQNQLGGLYGQMGQQALGQQQLSQGALNANNQINSGIEMSNTQGQNAIVGGLLGAGAAFAAGGAKKAHGGYIDGPELVPGDHEANDVVPILASGGEIVIPKSKSSDPAKAKSFIDQIMKDKKPKDESGAGYGKILDLKRRIAALEKKVSS